MAEFESMTTGVSYADVRVYKQNIEQLVSDIKNAIDNHGELDDLLSKNWSGKSYDQFVKDFASMTENVKAQITGQLANLDEVITEIANSVAALDNTLAE